VGGEMTSILVTKHLGGLRPVDDIGTAYFSKIKHGKQFLVEIKRARNPRHHRLFWALCALVADNSRHFQDAEQVATAFKVATGHVVPQINPADGKTYWFPKSIAYHAMPQDEFSAFFEKCVSLVVERLLPGVTDQQVRENLESMCGISSVDTGRRASQR